MTQNVAFGFRVDETKATKEYLRLLRRKLKTGTQLFHGDMKRVDKGLYVLGLEMLIDLSVFLTVWLVLAGMSLGLLLLGLHTPAMVVFVSATVLFLIVSVFYAPEFYRLVLYVQCSRASKRHVWVRNASEEVLMREVLP